MKIIRIPAPNTWRPDARMLFHFGDYRVPQDMSEELAERAIAEGVAELLPRAEREPYPAKRAKLETKRGAA